MGKQAGDGSRRQQGWGRGAEVPRGKGRKGGWGGVCRPAHTSLQRQLKRHFPAANTVQSQGRLPSAECLQHLGNLAHHLPPLPTLPCRPYYP